MKPQGVSQRTGRRRFFKHAALLGGTAVLTVLGGRVKSGRTFDPPVKPRKQGYRMTAHIRKYYEKASL